MFPAITTINPAPDDNLMSLIFISKPLGLPMSFHHLIAEYCVLAIHTGSLSNPSL